MHVANIMPQDQKVYIVKAKFHYAIWFDAGSKLVADRFESDSVMEFGLKLSTTLVVGVARAHLHMHVNHLSRLLSDIVLLQNDETAWTVEQGRRQHSW